jgi:hypothetical protein
MVEKLKKGRKLNSDWETVCTRVLAATISKKEGELFFSVIESIAVQRFRQSTSLKNLKERLSEYKITVSGVVERSGFFISWENK